MTGTLLTTSFITTTASNISTYPYDFSIPSTSSLPTSSSSQEREFLNLDSVMSSSDAYNSISSDYSSPNVEDVGDFFPDLVHDHEKSPTPPKSRISSKRQSSSVSSDSSAPYDYRTMRDKNNIASRISRQKRQQKIKENKQEKGRLENKNVELKAKIAALEAQVEDYKKMVMMFAKK